MTELKESIALEKDRLDSALERLERAVEKNARMIEEQTKQQVINSLRAEIDLLKDELRNLHNKHNETNAELSDVSVELIHYKNQNKSLRETNNKIALLLKKSIGEIEEMVS